METLEMLASEEAVGVLKGLSDEMLMQLSFPLVGGSQRRPMVDEDGFVISGKEDLRDLHEWQQVCWDKATTNPQISSHVRDLMGRMAGWGFEFFSSKSYDVQEMINEIVDDPRNSIYQMMPKFIARTEIEGELFLCLTLHPDGFIEIDFIPPSMIKGGGDKNSGIIFHPTKQNFPLFYLVHFENDSSQDKHALIPSINICYYPELENLVKSHSDYKVDRLKHAKASAPGKAPYDKTAGYQRFMIHWNKGYMTKRNVSHIRTTIEWINHYEVLKKYEIDHKKSSGAYLWVIKMEDVKSFRNWLQMSEADRKKTGIMQPKDPGGTLVLPPGMSLECVNPKLPNISDQDTDIMQMVSSGLQRPQDTILGDYRSTYASVKASQGPQGDRINDELHYFKLFLIYDFWRPICYLTSLARSNFAYERSFQEVVEFKNKKPIKKKVTYPVYKLIDINLPTSRLEDVESIAKSLLGSKHASIVDTLGIPRDVVARRLGFSNYLALRRAKATEDEMLPETLSVMDQEGAQERAEGEKTGDPSDSEKIPTNKGEKPAPPKRGRTGDEGKPSKKST